MSEFQGLCTPGTDSDYSTALLSEESAVLGNKSDIDSESGYKEQDVILT